ncbi:uncharacterized protein Triagg1_10808 [Trichoderma aggressivum f. europaeum]|uniref:Uncharacterized protein n=1 Tax=Trichoderma aggressivum f. europaeum TaxID=173218 RepID=A0AAE1I5D7_9HYPO|nr:hypothetical protein Triagg1_10808 [Trichoderma aggressivum f. europaeum]
MFGQLKIADTMTTVASTATEAPTWKLRLRSAQAQIKAQESQGTINITAYLANPESFGIGHQSLHSAEDGVEKLNQHAGKLKDHLTLLRANSASDDKFEPITRALIQDHQNLSDDLKVVTDRLQDDRVDKRTAMERMREARQRAKKQSIDSIDKSYDNAVEITEHQPEDQQETAADAWVLIYDQFLELTDKIFNLFLDMHNAISQWLVDVWENVKEAWNKMKGVFVEIWQWFNDLFG